MNTLRNTLLAGLAALTLGGAAQAAPAGDGAPTHQQWAERAAARTQQLHDALHLTSAQETAWNNYQQALPKRGAERPARADWKAMSAPERLERQIAMARQHTEAMQARLAALQPLYASFTPEQKKLFDARAMGRGHHRHHGMQRGQG